MLNIEFDSEEAFDRTLDWLESAGDELSGELIIAVGNFYNKVDDVVGAINHFFDRF